MSTIPQAVAAELSAEPRVIPYAVVQPDATATLFPRVLKAAIDERDSLVSDLAIMEEDLARYEVKREQHPSDKALLETVITLSGRIDNYRKRLAKLVARIEKICADLDPTKREPHLATLERKKVSIQKRLLKHAATVDELGAQLKAAVTQNATAGKTDAKQIIGAITSLADGDPTSIARTVETHIPHIAGQHAFQASALAALFLRLARAMDCEYSIADYVIFNTSSINRTRTFAEVAEKSAAGIAARLDTVLVSNGRVLAKPEDEPLDPAVQVALAKTARAGK